MGTKSRFKETSKIRCSDFLKTVSVTGLPASPFKRETISRSSRFFPKSVSPSAIRILSPAMRPARALGPPSMALVIEIVSLLLKKLTPIPTKSPFIFSAIRCISDFGIYTECGSSFSRMLFTVTSTILSVFTSSTYS